SGGTFVVFEVVSFTVLQRVVSTEVLGRVFGILMSIGSAATFLASVIAPQIVQHVGLRAAVITGGAVPLVPLVLLARRLVAADRQAVEKRRALATTADVL